MFEDHIDVDYQLIHAALLIFCAFLSWRGCSSLFDSPRCHSQFGNLRPNLPSRADVRFSFWSLGRTCVVAFPSAVGAIGPIHLNRRFLSAVIEQVDADDNKQMDASEMNAISQKDIQQMQEAVEDSGGHRPSTPSSPTGSSFGWRMHSKMKR